jgi:hypothetical protein
MRSAAPHDEGVSAEPERRHFTTACKLKLIAEAARCIPSSAIASLPLREGVYSSHLAA